MNEFNLVFKDESFYGFLDDIIKMLKQWVEDCPDEELAKETLADAQKLLDETDDITNIYYFNYHAMGAFIIYKLTPERV